jgi:hypothetical protein
VKWLPQVAKQTPDLAALIYLTSFLPVGGHHRYQIVTDPLHAASEEFSNGLIGSTISKSHSAL